MSAICRALLTIPGTLRELRALEKLFPKKLFPRNSFPEFPHTSCPLLFPWWQKIRPEQLTEEGLVWGSSLRGKAWQQEREVPGHIASAVGKQTERDVGDQPLSLFYSVQVFCLRKG